MAFRQEDFKKTSRKSSAAGVSASVYPHQLKDKKAIARLEIAIRTFDAAAGKRRKDMDAQAMTDFFGDPRLARGIVACLGQFYKYETPDFRQLVGRDGAARLREAGLTRPVDVRAFTYAFVNERHHGFLAEGERAACYEALAEEFCLTAHQWDTLLHSDSEDNQILTRLGAVPTPADIVALYNFHSLDTVLRRSTQIALMGLSLTAADAAEIRALARALGVKAVVSADAGTVSLSESDVPSILPRRAGRLGRCLLHLISAYAARTTGGAVEARLGAKVFRLTLTTDLLRVLGMPLKAASLEKPAFKKRFEAGLALHKELLRETTKRRAAGEMNGWRVKRLPEPTVSALGIHMPDFVLRRSDSKITLMLGAESGTAGSDLTLSLPLGRKAFTGAEVLARAELAATNLFALPEAVPPSVPQDVLALCDRAVSEGMVKAADARRTLHLLDDSPLIEWMRLAADPRVRYIPGVGILSESMVTTIRGE
jgi:predicted nuclease of restriction endonuclease-like RecB superfamily